MDIFIYSLVQQTGKREIEEIIFVNLRLT